MSEFTLGQPVHYSGSAGPHGVYVVDVITDPIKVDDRATDEDMAAAYPDGKAYTIFPQDMPRKMDNVQNHSISNVRPGSLRAVTSG